MFILVGTCNLEDYANVFPFDFDAYLLKRRFYCRQTSGPQHIAPNILHEMYTYILISWNTDHTQLWTRDSSIDIAAGNGLGGRGVSLSPVRVNK
jgi:hypothetical protein